MPNPINCPRVMAWNVSESVLKCLDLYAKATGEKKYTIVEHALVEYFKKYKAQKVIKAYVDDMYIGDNLA